MDHGYFHDRISAWLDGDLPPYEAQVVGEHLDTCEECQALLAHLKQVDTLVEKHSQLDGDDDYWEAMAQKIEARLEFAGEEEVVTDIRPKKRSGLLWKIAAAAASVAVLTFVGLHQADIFRLKEQTAPARIMMPVDTTTEQEWLRDDSAEVERAREIAKGHEPAELTMEERSEPQAADRFADETPPPPPPKAPSADLKKTPRQEIKAETTPVETGRTEGQAQTQPQRVARPSTATAEESVDKLDEDLKLPGTIVVESPQGKDKTIKVAGPQEQVQQMLDSVKGVVTNTSGSVVRRDPLSGIAQNFRTDRDNQPTLGLINTSPRPMASDSLSLDLAGWMVRRDSLETLWAEIESEHGKLAITKGRKEASLSDAGLIERQLLEAYYNVGLLARESDQSAYESAVQALQSYLQRPDVQYRTTAREYLDRLAPDSLDRR